MLRKSRYQISDLIAQAILRQMAWRENAMRLKEERKIKAMLKRKRK